MARIPEEEIAEVRRRADIADIIGRYIPVQKSGRDYKAVCPFHDDHDPSMQISETLQIYKCFVCQAGGNVFSFVQKYENVSFPEAVEKVADLIGFNLSVRMEDNRREEDETTAKYHRILDETDEAKKQNWLSLCLLVRRLILMQLDILGIETVENM
jgi:DNA primase